MRRKLWFFSLPILLLPYLTLFTLATLFFSTSHPFFGWILDSVFFGNIFYLLCALLIWCILAIVSCVFCFFVSIKQQWDPLTLAKTAVTVTLAQIPAFILIFALGVVFLITVFTFGISVVLLLIDCLTVFLTGLFTIASAKIATRQGIFKPTEVNWVILLQFIFCADVISAIIFYRKLTQKCKYS